MCIANAPVSQQLRCTRPLAACQSSTPARYRLQSLVFRRHASVAKAAIKTTSGKAVVERKFSQVRTLIQDSEELVLHDPESQSVALAIWKAISEIPADQRTQLLDHLGSREIKRLWNLANDRYKVSASEDSRNIVGSDYNAKNEFPTHQGQVVTFRGRAAVPAFSRFSKIFFIDSKSQLYGHVDVGPPAKALFPLYFKCSTWKSVFPGTSEIADVQLEYLPLEDLGLDANSVPQNLPQPREPRWPFSGGLVDYMRPVGPGAFVGRGWKQPQGVQDPSRGSGFLYFVLIKENETEQN